MSNLTDLEQFAFINSMIASGFSSLFIYPLSTFFCFEQSQAQVSPVQIGLFFSPCPIFENARKPASAITIIFIMPQQFI